MSEFHVEVGAYALDALDESEREAFEQHLVGCRSCQRELAEFTETTARLGVLGDVAPPPELRGSLLDAIREVRPLPPLDAPPLDAPRLDAPFPTLHASPSDTPPLEVPRDTPPLDVPPRDTPPRDVPPLEVPALTESVEGAVAPRRALQPIDDAPGDRDTTPARRREPEPGPRDEHPVGGPDEPTDELTRRRLERQGRRARLLTVAVAAVTVIALAFGGWAYVLQRQQHSVASQSAAANQLLSAPDVKTYPVTVDGTPATFVVSKSLDQAMFVGADLPAAAEGRTYQLWTVDDRKQADPDVTFAGGPETRQFMTGDISGAAGLAVSIEPDGGSSQPTKVLASTAL